MQRTIKFRAWDKEEQEMLDWDKFFNLDIAQVFESKGSWGVYPMQYTGLKDANGVEIYEGDIVNWQGAVCYISWEESDASFMAVEQYDSWAESGQEWGGNCKVIGNIYQNPELLK